MEKEIQIGKITEGIQKEIDRFESTLQAKSLGRVVTVADGICFLKGLSQVGYGETVEFSNGVMGLVMGLDKDLVSVVILGDYQEIKEGAEARASGTVIKIPAGPGLLGRVINPLGESLDGRGKVAFEAERPVEKNAPGVIDRRSVNTSLATGIIAIDSLVPIGRGQRELIIGDRGTGKSAIAIDAIINQKETDVVCIYVAIGQKQNKIAQTVARLEKAGVLAKTVIVAASAADSAALQYLAPFSGCAIGEYFMEKGQHALVIYDDLTKHAWAYRQLSLLLKRPSGREAFPGDIFYLHSRLLERSAKLSPERGGGSLTALPIIETQAGDLSSYIPTNVISITDGQIFLDTDLFNSGIRPAINVGLSVSRVGGEAQEKAMKQVAGKLRLELAQYRELSTFAQFGSDLDKSTQEKLNRGSKLTEILKQPQYAPLLLAEEVVSLFAAVEGLWDDVPSEKVKGFSDKLLTNFRLNDAGLMAKINKDRKLDEDMLKEMRQKIVEYKKVLV